jgi:hypothetical protein
LRESKMIAEITQLVEEEVSIIIFKQELALVQLSLTEVTAAVKEGECKMKK